MLATSVVVAAAVVVLDQWTKRGIEAGLGPGSPQTRVEVLGDWFALEYAETRGAAFGLFAGSSAAVTAAGIVILAGLLLYSWGRGATSRWLGLGTGLVAGGAVGNLIDRLRSGYVVDFVAVGPWPNFNVADAAISVGVVCLAIDAVWFPGLPSAKPPGTMEGVPAGGQEHDCG